MCDHRLHRHPRAENQAAAHGIYLFAIMEWISAAGYRMFPLSSSGYAGAFQDMMHMVVTALVVLLSIVSLSVIIAAGMKDRSCRSYGMCAAVALCMMLVGAIGMNSSIFNNPFLIWGQYRRGLFRTTLPLSFQFHHTQMDGAHAGHFLQRLQEGILALEKPAAGAGTGGA